MKLSLVIMAAGLGSRYGGDKQVDGLGPNGEMLMEYSVCDALRAGFGRIVFVIKPGMEELMQRLVGQYLAQKRCPDGSPLEVRYVYQDYSSLPGGFTPPSGRTKPYGTVHALLCAESVVDGPFCVINADDYYGPDAYRTMGENLRRLPESGKALMVGYRLKNTVSLYGTVSRGICSLEAGRLTGVKETARIQMYESGSVRDLDADCELDPSALVSMNFWGYSHTIFPVLRRYLQDFLEKRGGEEKSECLLPVMVDDLMAAGELTVEVLHSKDRWFGVTYQEDRPRVMEALRELHQAGIYPPNLRA